MGRVLGHLLLLEGVVVHLPQELEHFRLRVRTGNRGLFERGDEGLLLFGPGSGLAVLFELFDALLPPLAREAGNRDQPPSTSSEVTLHTILSPMVALM